MNQMSHLLAETARDRAVKPVAIFKTASELKNATMNPQHPIAKATGKVMFSIMGYQEIKNVAGETILSENNGRPAWVIRNRGKGTSSYFAGYLGTAYGAGCSQYEWRDKHADDSPYRLLDAYDLIDLRTGDECQFKVKIFNPSASKLDAGEIQLRQKRLDSNAGSGGYTAVPPPSDRGLGRRIVNPVHLFGPSTQRNSASAASSSPT